MTSPIQKPHELPRRIAHKQGLEVQKLCTDIGHLQCATMTGPYSLSLIPGSHIQSYRELCSQLYVAGEQMDYVKTAINFLVGDALNQSEQVFGEEAACIYGVDVQWTMGYVNNVRRISRVIPSDLRDPGFSWHFYMDLAGASLDETELREYLQMGRSYQLEGHPNWRAITVDILNDEKVEEVIKHLPEEEQIAWRESYRRVPKHWRKIEKDIANGVEPPKALKTVAQVIIDLVDKNPEIPNNATVRDAVIDQMWEFHEMISKKTPGVDWRNA